MFLPAARIFVDWRRRRNHALAGQDRSQTIASLTMSKNAPLDILPFELSLDLAPLERHQRLSIAAQCRLLSISHPIITPLSRKPRRRWR